MNKYHNSKIYAIKSPYTDKFYIGSTYNELYKRFSQHKCPSRICRSKIIIDYGDAYIILIEKFKCENRIELNKREGELIRLHKNNIVNRNQPDRTKTQYLQDNKYNRNEQHKQYNKQKIICSICNLELTKGSFSKHNKRKHQR